MTGERRGIVMAFDDFYPGIGKFRGDAPEMGVVSPTTLLEILLYGGGA